MSEAAAEDNVVSLPEANWADPHPLERRPQALDTDAGTARSNHLITISMTAKGSPMVVLRGDTAEEIAALGDSLETAGVYAMLAVWQRAMMAEGAVGGILGAVSAMSPEPPQAAPPAAAWGAPAAAQPAAWGPPQPSPGPAPFGAMPQPQWGAQPVAGNTPPPAWAVAQMSVDFRQKDAWSAFRTGPLQQACGGRLTNDVKWNGDGKVWWLSARAASFVQSQSGGQFGTPMPIQR